MAYITFLVRALYVCYSLGMTTSEGVNMQPETKIALWTLLITTVISAGVGALIGLAFGMRF